MGKGAQVRTWCSKIFRCVGDDGLDQKDDMESFVENEACLS